jgi:hypothetical protein
MVVGSQVESVGVVSFHYTKNSLFTERDDANVGPRLLVSSNKWSLLHPTQGDWFEFGT